jgi:hypothetical protein
MDGIPFTRIAPGAAAVSVLVIAGCGATQTTARPSAPVMTPNPDMTAETITAALQRAGLVKGKVIAYNATTDPNHLLGRFGGYTSKTEWDQQEGNTKFDSVEVFPTPGLAQERIAYLESFGPLISDGYDYLTGISVLRVSALDTPAQAHALEAVFDKTAS